MQAHFEREVTVVYDEIWLACGETVNIAHDPALQRLIQTTPTEIAAAGCPRSWRKSLSVRTRKASTQPAAPAGKAGAVGRALRMYVIGAYAARTIGRAQIYPWDIDWRRNKSSKR